MKIKPESIIKTCAILLFLFCLYYTVSFIHTAINYLPVMIEAAITEKVNILYRFIIVIILGHIVLISMSFLSGIGVYKLKDGYRKLAIFTAVLNFIPLLARNKGLDVIVTKTILISLSLLVIFSLLNKKIKEQFK